MDIIFEVTDITKRKIYLTKKRFKHIMEHNEIQNKLEEIKETLMNPHRIIEHRNNSAVKSYYRYYKIIGKYLKVIVKYLNGNGFIISSYFVRSIHYEN